MLCEFLDRCRFSGKCKDFVKTFRRRFYTGYPMLLKMALVRRALDWWEGTRPRGRYCFWVSSAGMVKSHSWGQVHSAVPALNKLGGVLPGSALACPRQGYSSQKRPPSHVLHPHQATPGSVGSHPKSSALFCNKANIWSVFSLIILLLDFQLISHGQTKIIYMRTLKAHFPQDDRLPC